MKLSLFLFVTLLLMVFSTPAQTNFAQSVSFAPPNFGANLNSAAALPVNSSSSPAQPTFAASEPFASAFAPPAPLPAAAEPQAVQGVFEKYSYDVYGGYTFFRLYEVPGV